MDDDIEILLIILALLFVLIMCICIGARFNYEDDEIHRPDQHSDTPDKALLDEQNISLQPYVNVQGNR